jgi:hypothetical protein
MERCGEALRLLARTLTDCKRSLLYRSVSTFSDVAAVAMLEEEVHAQLLAAIQQPLVT